MGKKRGNKRNANPLSLSQGSLSGEGTAAPTATSSRATDEVPPKSEDDPTKEEELVVKSEVGENQPAEKAEKHDPTAATAAHKEDEEEGDDEIQGDH